ncbi:hypothetical protein [Streptomyces lycii]|uniref:Integral membrane protein n=1 Tax=Streptomyces lycii TaxID=2654337 RepID=A0ABQ7FLF4_9ACTN|nr:hypothetical protein [Streptomyces lycii]KAF4409782.1 hypothetical protein GCU69_07210 [Streptomyces lycii]
MYGPVPTPQQRPAVGSSVIVLRVLFVAATLLSFGLLAWVAMLRTAFLRRRQLDWALFVVVMVLSVGCLAVVGSVPETDWRGDLGMAVMLIMMVAVVAHYLVVDVRHHQQPPHGVLYGPAAGIAPGVTQPYPAAAGGVTAPGGGIAQAPTMAAYGYPGQAPPRQYPQAPPAPAPGSGPAPAPFPPQTTAPSAASPQAPRTPQRIDRVRAELDELSDLLRKEEGTGR